MEDFGKFWITPIYDPAPNPSPPALRSYGGRVVRDPPKPLAKAGLKGRESRC
jgi:hypothetical protein